MKWCSAIAGCVLLLHGVCAQDLAALPANTWVEVTPKYEGAPSGGQIFPMGWNNKGAYDPQSKRVLVMDRWYDKLRSDTIYANAVLAYDPALNVCTVIKVSNWKKEGTPAGGYKTVTLPEEAADPTPLDRHPLGSVAFSPDRNTLYLANGLNQTGPAGHPNDSWAFDLNKKAWTKIGEGGSGKAHPPHLTCDVMTYDAQAKAVVLFSSAQGKTQAWLLDSTKSEWKVQPQDASAAGIAVQGSGIAYDSKRGLIACFGGGGQYDSSSGQLCVYSTAQNKWKRLKDCPAAANAAGFDYDSKNDAFLAIFGGATWVYSAAADTWTELLKDGVPAFPWKSSTYAAAHDVFVYQGGTWDKPVWKLLRYRPAQAVAAPAKLPASQPKSPRP